mmetsp:Transcript_119779/g.207930  ORF Transcript_119779/g.207930 Transcript_119779/m.207930 type:complete len:254 (-) Transcript_119779:85-846(-)
MAPASAGDLPSRLRSSAAASFTLPLACTLCICLGEAIGCSGAPACREDVQSSDFFDEISLLQVGTPSNVRRRGPAHRPARQDIANVSQPAGEMTANLSAFARRNLTQLLQESSGRHQAARAKEKHRRRYPTNSFWDAFFNPAYIDFLHYIVAPLSIFFCSFWICWYFTCSPMGFLEDPCGVHKINWDPHPAHGQMIADGEARYRGASATVSAAPAQFRPAPAQFLTQSPLLKTQPGQLSPTKAGRFPPPRLPM